MKRRQFLLNTAATISTASLARPEIVRAASASTLKFVPYADLALLDPLGSAFVTRDHVMMVFDTLFALDATGVGHLISWAGLCPRNDQSAGKRRSTRMRKGVASIIAWPNASLTAQRRRLATTSRDRGTAAHHAT